MIRNKYYETVARELVRHCLVVMAAEGEAVTKNQWLQFMISGHEDLGDVSAIDSFGSDLLHKFIVIYAVSLLHLPVPAFAFSSGDQEFVLVI